MRVVIDTNLFISYLIGKKLKALDTVLKEKRTILIISQQQLEEIRRVSRRDKFKKFFTPAKAKALFENIDTVAEIIEIKSQVTVCRDPKDNYLLAMSKDGKANYLVSGDDDLLTLKKFNRTKIVTFTEFINIIK